MALVAARHAAYVTVDEDAATMPTPIGAIPAAAATIGRQPAVAPERSTTTRTTQAPATVLATASRTRIVIVEVGAPLAETRE